MSSGEVAVALDGVVPSAEVVEVGGLGGAAPAVCRAVVEVGVVDGGLAAGDPAAAVAPPKRGP